MLAASDLASWNLQPLQLLPTILVSVLYLRRTRTLARRGQPVGTWRQFFSWLGIALLVLAINSPIDTLGERGFFFVHMTQHMLLGDLAPLCFDAGRTGPVLRPVLAIRPFDRLRVLTNPFVALPVWAVTSTSGTCRSPPRPLSGTTRSTPSSTSSSSPAARSCGRRSSRRSPRPSGSGPGGS